MKINSAKNKMVALFIAGSDNLLKQEHSAKDSTTAWKEIAKGKAHFSSSSAILSTAETLVDVLQTRDWALPSYRKWNSTKPTTSSDTIPFSQIKLLSLLAQQHGQPIQPTIPSNLSSLQLSKRIRTIFSAFLFLINLIWVQRMHLIRMRQSVYKQRKSLAAVVQKS